MELPEHREFFIPMHGVKLSLGVTKRAYSSPENSCSYVALGKHYISANYLLILPMVHKSISYNNYFVLNTVDPVKTIHL